MAKVGARLRELREERGVSVRALARQLDMAHTVLSKWERGTARIDADALPLIARRLGVETAAFYEEPPESQPSLLNVGVSLGDEARDEIRRRYERLHPHDRRIVTLAFGIIDEVVAAAS